MHPHSPALGLELTGLYTKIGRWDTADSGRICYKCDTRPVSQPRRVRRLLDESMRVWSKSSALESSIRSHFTSTGTAAERFTSPEGTMRPLLSCAREGCAISRDFRVWLRSFGKQNGSSLLEGWQAANQSDILQPKWPWTKIPNPTS